MNWLILTIISAATNSISRILQRTMLKHEDSDSFAFSFIFPVLVSIAIFLYAVLNGGFQMPNLLPVWFNVILMIIFYSVGSVCVYQAYKESPASEISIIFATSSMWSAITAVMFLSEKLSMANIYGIVLIILGVITLNYTKSKWQLQKGHLYAIVGAIFFGAAFTNDAFIISYYSSVSSYVFLAFILPALGILAYKPKLALKLPHFFSKKVIGKLALTAVIYATSAITIYTAYKLGGQASIISPIQQTSIVLTVILGYFLLGEKDRPIQKTLGSIMAFSGVLLLL